MRWTEAIGRTVISTGSADSIGKVDGLVADPATQRIVAIVVGDDVVSWSDCGGIGPDAVTVTDSGLLGEPSSDLQTRTVKGENHPIGKTVLTENGLAIGSLGDIDFDPQTGQVDALILADDELNGSRLMGIGSYAVVVAEAE